MFIIWGTKTTTSQIGCAGNQQCSRCGNIRNWVVIKKTSWFTLFFIPLIPFNSKYYVMCPVCNSGQQISKEACNNILTGNI